MNLLALTLLACAAPEPCPEPIDEDRPTFEVKFRNNTDKVKVTYPNKPKGVLLTITGAGTGSADLERKKGKDPQRLTILFSSLQPLNSFSVTNGKFRFSAYHGGVGKSTYYYDQNGSQLKASQGAKITLTVEKTKEGMEVVFDFAKGVTPDKKWSMSWVDYYRKRGKGLKDK